MRLLIITTGLDVGGAERAIYNLVLGGLDKMGEIHVVSLRDTSYYGELFRSHGVNVTCLNLQNPINLLTGFFKIFLLMKNYKPNLIQGWMYHGNIFSLLASCLTLSKVKVVWGVRQTIYDINKEKLLTRLIIRLCSKLSPFVDRIIYNSQKSKTQHEALGFDLKGGFYVPNGFDMSVWRPKKSTRRGIRLKLNISNDAFVIGYIGRYHPMKNIPMIFDAMKEIIKKKSDVVFLIVGENTGKENPDLLNYYEHLPLDQIVSLGIRHDVPDIMKCTDLLCLTSSWGEGFPNVIGEAMSSGVPCISTDIGDSALVINNTGWIVPAKDVKSFSVAIKSAITESKEVYQSRSLSCIKRIFNNYQIQMIINKYIEIYSSIK